MAFCDYHPCDLFGEHKTFYDANMDYEQHDNGSLTYCGHRRDGRWLMVAPLTRQSGQGPA